MTLKIKYSIIVVLISYSFHAHGQFSWGIKAGVNINDIAVKDVPAYIDDDPKMSIGFHAGFYGDVKISEKLSFIPELQFSQRGIKESSSVRINLNYIEMPLLVSYSLFEWCSIDLGPNVSYKISAVARGNGLSNNIDWVYEKDTDFGLTSGVRILLSEKLTLIGRYYWGLSSLDEVYFQDLSGQTTISREYNRTVQIGIGYRFKKISNGK